MINDKVLNIFSEELNKSAAIRNFVPMMSARTDDRNKKQNNMLIASIMDDVIMAAIRNIKGV
jgi:hypothetical protein